jgi:hypothetical protein
VISGMGIYHQQLPRRVNNPAQVAKLCPAIPILVTRIVALLADEQL